MLDPPFERPETIDALWRAVEDAQRRPEDGAPAARLVGLSYNEIADSLEMTLATVKWRIFKAREDVQLSLAREGIEVYEEREVPRSRLRRVGARRGRAAPPALPAA